MVAVDFFFVLLSASNSFFAAESFLDKCMMQPKWCQRADTSTSTGLNIFFVWEKSK